jgi:hypothetical protein
MLGIVSALTSTGNMRPYAYNNMSPYAYSNKLSVKLTSDATMRHEIGALFLRKCMRMDVRSQLQGSATVPLEGKPPASA